MEPWLGKSTQGESFPLPQIIDIRIDRTSGSPYKKIKNKLETAIPGTTVHDHNVWVSSLVATLQSAELIALAIVVLITMATIGTVIFTTRTGMGIHKQTIEVLHFVGAHDNFIARQFAIRAFIVGLQGGICGVILASPILYLFQYILTKMETGLLPYSTIDGTVLIGVGLVIPIVSLIAMFTAQSTVLKTLRKMV